MNFVGDGLRDAFDPRAEPGALLMSDVEVTVSLGEVPMSDTLLEVTDLAVQFPTDDGLVQRRPRGVVHTRRAERCWRSSASPGRGSPSVPWHCMGLLPKTARVSGSVTMRGAEVLGLRGSAARPLRGDKIAMIFQDPMTAMNPVYTVGDQLAEAYRAHNRVSPKVAQSRALEMLDLVGIPQAKSRMKSYPHEFSGGMRQRAMIAMAIINDPEIIIADEPTTALDVTVQAQILETLNDVKDQVNSAVILITHDLGVVAGMADRVLVMYAGRVVEQAVVAEIYDQPRMPYTAGLLGSIPALDSIGGKLHPIAGSPPSMVNMPAGCPFAARCPLVSEACLRSEPPLAPTDLNDHGAACHHWDQVAATDDPTLLFRAGIGV